jgi:hypothetical protein
MIQLVSVPSDSEGSPVEKTSVFFRPTLQPPLLTVSSAQTELQYPFGVTLLCFAWLKKYHWLPAPSALPRKRRFVASNQDPDKNEYIISLESVRYIHTIQFPWIIVIHTHCRDDVWLAW